MQKYTEIAENQTLKESRELLLNNDKTALSNSSGTSFPTQNVQIGQFCFRTDEATLYQCTSKNTWTKLVTFIDGLPIFYNVPTYGAATSSKLGLVKTGSNITNQKGTIFITDENIISALGYKPPRQDTTYGAATSSQFGLVKTGSNITNISGTISLTKSNVKDALGYLPPSKDTTYERVTPSADGLMSPAMLAKLNDAGDHGTVVASHYGVNGYRKWSDGFIEQWGKYEITTGNWKEYSFPIAFPNACYGVVTTPVPDAGAASAAASVPATIASYTKTSFTAAIVGTVTGWGFVLFAVGK